jgi:hypothetical protein
MKMTRKILQGERVGVGAKLAIVGQMSVSIIS